MSKVELLTVDIDSIEIGERFRKDYGDLSGLADSISRRGLISPIAVQRQKDGSEKPFKLLAGGRRLAALRAKDIKEVQVRVFPPSLSEIEVRSIELAENFYRKDLEWTEYLALQKEIHELQLKLEGKKESTSTSASGWSFQKTAELLGRSKASVVQDYQLATAVESHPELFKHCKNKHEATKVLEKVGKEIITKELAKRAESATKLSTKRIIESYVVKDVVEFTKSLPSSTFDLVEFDPPFGIDLPKVKHGFSKIDTYDEIPTELYIEFLQTSLKEIYRTMTNDSWLIMWYAIDPWHQVVLETLRSVGFKLKSIPGLWVKKDATGQTQNPELYLGSNAEYFFYAAKGSPRIQQQGRSNVFEYKQIPSQKKFHKTEKPIELLQDILSTFTPPGSKIYVPCCGSGNSIIAAYKLNMTAVGCDISPAYRDSFVVKVSENF